MKKISEEWLKSASDDLRVIDRILSDEALTHMVAFHSQQAIEKSFKSIIEEYELGHARIHNLERLLEVVRPHVKIDVEIVLIQKLDKLYIDARYPADLGLLPNGKPTMEDAREFYSKARSIVQTAEMSLKNRHCDRMEFVSGRKPGLSVRKSEAPS